ncbi:MAG: helix-turn-helix domain-containing protein, partial [Chloroflexi bacterium]|nr:helix-turn-helix domain-containing protein [Chloroflexota bacterium]
RGGSSARAVYLAHLAIVTRCGKDPHGASARELGELAGVSWQTAANANQRLVDLDLLELTQPATPSLAHVWRLLTPPDLAAGAYLDTPSPGTVMECQGMHAHDAFRWAGLNKSGAEVLAALSAGAAVAATDITAQTGRHRTTVQRKLMAMAQLGLVEPVGDGWWRVVPGVDLDRAATELGTAGAGDRQRSQHQRDRRAHRLLLTRTRDHRPRQ